MPTPSHFDFAFATAYRLPALLFGVTPATSGVEVTGEELRVRFGPWKLVTPLDNIASCEETGGFRWIRTAGPAHLSLTDHGVTFATNPDRALCVRFHEPVSAIAPWGLLRHPGATVTVARPDALREALSDRSGPVG